MVILKFKFETEYGLLISASWPIWRHIPYASRYVLKRNCKKMKNRRRSLICSLFVCTYNEVENEVNRKIHDP